MGRTLPLGGSTHARAAPFPWRLAAARNGARMQYLARWVVDPWPRLRYGADMHRSTRLGVRAFGLVAAIFLGAFLISSVIRLVAPVRLHIGMAWSDAKRNLECVPHIRVRSGISVAVTGSNGVCDKAFYLLPDNTCVEIGLRRPIHSSGNQNDTELEIGAFALGPLLQGYGGKIRWIAFPKTHPETLDLSPYSYLAITPYSVAILASIVVLKRLLRPSKQLPQPSP